MKRILLTSAALILAVVWLSCNSDSPTSTAPPSQIPDLSQTPREDQEAEFAAMVVSHELIAPQWMYDRIRSDLELIRGEFGDSLPVRRIKFSVYWVPSSILARIAVAELNDPETGGRGMFDSLVDLYRLKGEISFSGDTIWPSMYFEGILNPVRLIAVFSQVHGVRALWTNWRAGDWPMIYILPLPNRFLYFFRDAWGDCPSGCIVSKFYYFRTVRTKFQEQAEFVGSYMPTFGHPELDPNWFDTLLLARKNTLYDTSWFADVPEPD